jgi:Transposase
MSSSDNSSSSDKNDEGVPPNKPAPIPVVMRRRRFTVQQKMNIIQTVTHLIHQQEGMCFVEACRDMNIHPSMHLRWIKQAPALIERKRMNVRARSTYAGRIGCLAE